MNSTKLKELGNTGLRCGHWVLRFKGKRVKKEYEKGWHGGKFYAYMYCLVKFGWANEICIDKIKSPGSYLKNFHKGEILLFSKLGWNYIFLMKPRYFEKCLNYPDPANSPQTIKEIRKECKKI